MKKFKYALSFFKRIGLVSDFLKDSCVSKLKKLKLIMLLVFGFIYFISPLDLIPEVILGFGIIDDGVVILYLLTEINKELDKYELKSKNIKHRYHSEYGSVIDNIEYDIKDKS
ncbi:MAG: DUF1232 domain-containing protein [Tepidibacter sp.]|jgi:uncharacterized membrane protein YkvA (DUF1232 family)|uniref:YkvA family protein n=1 Tax=Tepidibacter sp. TaxID=2529387 RepID=UPI0025DA516C|nr:DUF1232 domain-containing protein [Tepidibacter sp.]MCT4507501.1 DUF1232 domain-containing protein [Tepidibacter sp.]